MASEVLLRGVRLVTKGAAYDFLGRVAISRSEWKARPFLQYQVDRPFVSRPVIPGLESVCTECALKQTPLNLGRRRGASIPWWDPSPPSSPAAAVARNA